MFFAFSLLRRKNEDESSADISFGECTSCLGWDCFSQLSTSVHVTRSRRVLVLTPIILAIFAHLDKTDVDAA